MTYDRAMSKLFSETVARKLMVGGTIGFVTGAILTFVIVWPLYSSAAECIADTASASACSDNLDVERVGARLVSILMYVSLVAIIAGVVMMIATSLKAKWQLPLKKKKR